MNLESCVVPPLAAPPCSASCGKCDHWEVRVNGAGGEPYLGYCPIFDKLKWYYEGKNCTAFSKPNTPIKQSHEI